MKIPLFLRSYVLTGVLMLLLLVHFAAFGYSPLWGPPSWYVLWSALFQLGIMTWGFYDHRNNIHLPAWVKPLPYAYIGLQFLKFLMLCSVTYSGMERWSEAAFHMITYLGYVPVALYISVILYKKYRGRKKPRMKSGCDG